MKATGAKLWRFNYCKPFTKKRTEISLGRFPEVSLKQARDKRAEYRALLAENIDPQTHRQQEKLKAKIPTLFEMAQQWYKLKETQIKPNTLNGYWRMLNNHLFPKSGYIPINEILPPIIKTILQPLEKRKATLTIHRILSLLNEIMSFAINSGLIETNRCISLSKTFTQHKRQHLATIRPEELPDFLNVLHNYKALGRVKTLILWQLLTMTRPSEAAGAKWAEIDLTAKTWTIPASRMKMGKEHIIPLSTQAISLLRFEWQFSHNSSYVFPSIKRKNKPPSSRTQGQAISATVFRNRLTAHGLRSIASTYLNEYEPMINSDVIEACLSHVIGSQVRRAYNRSNYLEHRKPVMQLWGDYVEQCAPPNTFPKFTLGED
ncbi:hypothetical protein A4G19_12655 [Pasteurellaceae bacterium Macca]|nr:hypothetical protein [Pasteurellaceae bacterium Macca]